MDVLEKILEEIEEATFQEDAPVYVGDVEVDGYVRASRVKEIIRAHMDETISEMEKVEKEKVTSAEIISREIDGKPYYHIKYKKVGEDEYTIGYSSFKLDYVVKWLNDYFEFCGEAKVSCENSGWIPVEERLPEDEGNVLVVVTGRYKAVRFENAIMLGNYSSTDKDWIIEGWEEWENPNVIAWQPLPNPYNRK